MGRSLWHIIVASRGGAIEEESQYERDQRFLNALGNQFFKEHVPLDDLLAQIEIFIATGEVDRETWSIVSVEIAKWGTIGGSSQDLESPLLDEQQVQLVRTFCDWHSQIFPGKDSRRQALLSLVLACATSTSSVWLDLFLRFSSRLQSPLLDPIHAMRGVALIQAVVFSVFQLVEMLC